MHLKISSPKQWPLFCDLDVLTHWGQVTHVFVSKLIITAFDNVLSLGQRLTMIWIHDGSLLISEKLRWKLNWNVYTFINEKAFENATCKNNGQFVAASTC